MPNFACSYNDQHPTKTKNQDIIFKLLNAKLRFLLSFTLAAAITEFAFRADSTL